MDIKLDRTTGDVSFSGTTTIIDTVDEYGYGIDSGGSVGDNTMIITTLAVLDLILVVACIRTGIYLWKTRNM